MGINQSDGGMGPRENSDQEAAYKKLINSMATSTRTFVLARDEMVEAGVVSADEANSLPEIKNLAHKKLINSMATSTRTFVLARDEMARAGFDIPISKEILRIAKVRLESALSVSETRYEQVREELVDAGIYGIQKTKDTQDSQTKNQDWEEFFKGGEWTAMTNFDPSTYEWRGEEISKKIEGMIKEFGEDNVIVGPEYDFDKDSIISDESSNKKCIYIRRESSEITEE